LIIKNATYVKQKLTLHVIYQSLSPVKTIINFAKCATTNILKRLSHELFARHTSRYF